MGALGTSVAAASLDDPRERALAAYEQGYNAYRRGDLSGAVALLQRAVAVEPNLIKAHYWLGKVYRELGRLDDAVHHWEETVRLRQLIADRRLALALEHNETPAEEQLASLRERQKVARAAYHKGQALLAEGQWAAALASFQAAVAAYPAHPDYLLALARAQWDNRDRLGAVRTYGDLIDAGPTTPAVASEAVARMLAVGQADRAKTFVNRLSAAAKLATQPLLAGHDALVASAQPPLPVPGLGAIIMRKDGQVVIDIGFNQGLKLSDEYTLALRVVRPGVALGTAAGLDIGRGPDRVVGELLITKVLTSSAWALVRHEFGTGIKEGDRVEIQGTSRR